MNFTLPTMLPGATLILQALLALFMGCTLYVCIYNRCLHPLANFPGPFLGSLTDWYLVYVICSVPTFGLELHKKYGPIVRLVPNLLSFSDPTLLPQIYHRSTDKPAFYGSWMFGHTASMFQSLKHADHYAKKRLVAPCCSMNAMKTHHEAKIDERIEEFCAKLSERSSATGRALDFSEHLRWFLSDVWSHLVYGKPYGPLAQGRDVNELLAAIQGVYSMSASAANFDRLMDRRRLESDLRNETLFFDGLDPKHNSREFQYSREDLRAEVITFTAATLDGVAAFISPFIDNLITHPAAYARLVEEIQAADRAGHLKKPVVAYDETTRLPFFMACINETLRRYAPAQTILPRLVSSPGYHLFGGKVYVPAGTQMGASPYIIHRDEAIFGADPDTWKPERWIQEESGMDARTHEAYIKKMEKYGMWWGYGDRECAGKYYAEMEMQKLCVELLRRFDIETPTPGKRFTHARWAVGMFWGQQLIFKGRN
ncbi:cytochrome P450 [Cercophora scortea]|uniref:Cytochrome P450 n=1 Tax=Cercophora scortea TaxID=314031 RepID=A0AAE0I8B5_9PEZI|nr:cytochrome P450 [Cercophora scortea]